MNTIMMFLLIFGFTTGVNAAWYGIFKLLGFPLEARKSAFKMCLLFGFIVSVILALNYEAKAGVFVGLDKTENSLGVTASETNFFDRSDGFKRYGAGHFRSVLGNSSGFKIQSHGGFILKNSGNLYEDRANLFLGLGMGNFTGNLTTKKEEQDFYMFYPGLDAGIFLNNHNNKAFVSFSFKAGETIQNLYDRGMEPELRSYYGNQLYVKTPILDLGYEKIWFGYNHSDSIENQMAILNLPRENWEDNKRVIFKRQLIEKRFNEQEQSLALLFSKEIF